MQQAAQGHGTCLVTAGCGSAEGPGPRGTQRVLGGQEPTQYLATAFCRDGNEDTERAVQTWASESPELGLVAGPYDLCRREVWGRSGRELKVSKTCPPGLQEPRPLRDGERGPQCVARPASCSSWGLDGVTGARWGSPGTHCVSRVSYEAGGGQEYR